MSPIVVFLIIVVLVVLDYFISKKFEEIAEMKGHSGYMGLCFWLGLAGWIMVASLPDRNSCAETSESKASASAPQDDALPEL